MCTFCLKYGRKVGLNLCPVVLIYRLVYASKKVCYCNHTSSSRSHLLCKPIYIITIAGVLYYRDISAEYPLLSTTCIHILLLYIIYIYIYTYFFPFTVFFPLYILNFKIESTPK